jgi:HK97 gp10 family phage protein
MTGMEELFNQLDSLGEDASKALKEAVMKGAEIVREDASRRAPRRTGKLSQSIIIESAEVEPDYVSVKIGPNKEAFYGRFVEMGTSKMPAKPFLRPAWDANKENVKKIISDELKGRLGL